MAKVAMKRAALLAAMILANQGTKKVPGKTVSVIDVETRRVARTVVTGTGAHGVAIDAAGRYAFITNIYANTVSVIDAASAQVLRTVPVGREPNGISVAP